MNMRPTPHRNGLTLLEVILAMMIFLISLIAIYQLISLGNERAIDVKLKTRTSLRCQSKLNEIIVGAQSMTFTGSYTGFPDDTDDPPMQWKMEATQTSAVNLYSVKVSVKVDLPTGKTIESQLCQMVLDPTKRGSTMDLPNPTTTTP